MWYWSTQSSLSTVDQGNFTSLGWGGQCMHACMQSRKSLFIHTILGSIWGTSGTLLLHFATYGSHYCEATLKFEKAGWYEGSWSLMDNVQQLLWEKAKQMLWSVSFVDYLWTLNSTRFWSFALDLSINNLIWVARFIGGCKLAFNPH